MDEVIVSRFAALRPTIKARWAAALCTMPPPVPAAAGQVAVTMLVYLLDGTLTRLAARLVQPPAVDRRRPDLPSFGTIRAGCRCGLHLLLRYYVTGVRALRATLPLDFGRARVEVVHHFNRIAHEEMAVLCGPCHHRGGALCGLRNGA